MKIRGEIPVDEESLRRTSCGITEQSELFEANLKQLAQCMEDLSAFWSGVSARTFADTFACDLEELESVSAVFRKLSQDYRFALDEYEKNARRAMEITSALRI